VKLERLRCPRARLTWSALRRRKEGRREQTWDSHICSKRGRLPLLISGGQHDGAPLSRRVACAPARLMRGVAGAGAVAGWLSDVRATGERQTEADRGAAQPCLMLSVTSHHVVRRLHGQRSASRTSVHARFVARRSDFTPARRPASRATHKGRYS
jgi:hypothetical protein